MPASLVAGSLDDLERHVHLLSTAALLARPVRARGARLPTPRAGSGASRRQPPGHAAVDPAAHAAAVAPELLELCRDGARRIVALIAELRAFLRGQESPGPHEVVDLAKLAHDAIRLASRTRRSGVPPVVTMHEDLSDGVRVSGNASALSRVLVNLVVNALDAVERIPHPAVSVRVSAAVEDFPPGGRREATVVVSDNGAGIPASDRERVFDAFYTTKGGADGLGLGLAIARETLAAHGGTIALGDDPLGGASIVVRLPLAEASPPGAI